MSEVGLVPFARVALEVSREVVPPYGHRFSPQRFTQPQLLAILCLMRYEDWTFRAAEVRLAEHGELRRALELQTVPDYSTLFRFMLRVEEQLIAKFWPRWCAVFKAASLHRATAKVPWRWMLRGWLLEPSARFSFVDGSSTAALRCHGVIGSNGSWLSIRVCT